MAFCQEVGAVPLDSVVTFNSNLSAPLVKPLSLYISTGTQL